MKRKNNNGIFYVAISLVAIFAVVVGVRAYTNAQNINVSGDYIYNEAEQVGDNDLELGAVSGPDHYETQRFYNNFVVIGEANATSSDQDTYTLTASDLDGNHNYIEWTHATHTTITTMASSAMPWLGEEAGATQRFFVYNASSTSGATITWAAGTGVDLQEDEGETVVQNGLEIAELIFIRKSADFNGDVILWIRMGQVGD